MHMPYSDGELEPLLEFSRARAVICAPADAKRDRPQTMDALRERLPLLDHVIVARGRAEGRGSCAWMIWLPPGPIPPFRTGRAREMRRCSALPPAPPVRPRP